MAWNEPGKSNDPDKDIWKRHKSDGPPDLDALFRSFFEKLSGLFGKKKDSGGMGGNPSSGNGSVLSQIWVLVGLCVVWLLAGIYIVDPGEEAVVLRLGQYHETHGPGPHWVLRFIDKPYILDVQKIANFTYDAQMLTKDENIVSVALAVQYRIGDPMQYLFLVDNPQESLHQATASALRQAVGHTTLDEVLTTGRTQLRGQVLDQIILLMDMYKTGIVISDVSLLPASAPEAVKAAFDDAIMAQEDEQRIINKAQEYAKGVVPAAEGEAKRIVLEAQAYRQQVIAKSQGEASQFLALLPEYRRAPKVTRERLYLEAVGSVLSRSSKIVVDAKGNNLLYLPLDKIVAQTQQNAAAANLSDTAIDSALKSGGDNEYNRNDAYKESINARRGQGRSTYLGRNRG